MSETTFGNYSSGADTSASEVFFGEGPAESADYDPADDYDPAVEYDPGAVEDDDVTDEYDEELPQDLESMIAEAMRRGLSSSEAVLEARQRADAWWQNWSQERAYEAHVEEQAALAEAYERGDDLIEEAAQRHRVPNQHVDSGFVREAANALHMREERLAFDRGDIERVQWLQSPAGAEAAIDEAARRTAIGSFAQHAHKGLGENPESEARARSAFDNFAKRTGLVSIRGVG